MKRRALALSTRALIPRTAQTWTCRRCLAQSAAAPIAGDDFIAPPSTPQQSHDIQTSSIFARTAISASSSSLDSAATRGQSSAKANDAPFEERFLAQDDTSLSDAQRDRRKELLRTLRKDLRHPLPSQYLTHVDIDALTPTEQEQRRHLYTWAMTGHVNDKGEPKEHAKETKGVVVSAGKMDRTVKVRIPGQRWEPRIKKYYASHTDHLVHDPNNSLLEGDIVVLHRLSVAKSVKYVVGSVPVPYGKPLADRPPIPTPEERLAEYKARRFAKFERQEERRQAAANSETDTSQLNAAKNGRSAGSKKTVGQKAAETVAKHQAKADSNIIEARSKTSDLLQAGLNTKSVADTA